MIAICREDSLRKSREERYALRRILVGRLQQVCRGIPRRARFQTHRQFAEEWGEYARQGRLDLVHRALVVGPAVAAEAGEGWRKSILLSLAADVIRPGDAIRTVRESAGATVRPAVDSDEGAAPRARVWSTPGRRPTLQEDLFPPQLIPQPA